MAKKKKEEVIEELEVVDTDVAEETQSVEAELLYSDDGDVAVMEEEAKAEIEDAAEEAVADATTEAPVEEESATEEGLDVVEEKPLAPVKPNSRFFIGFSYFALMIGAVMLILNKFIDSVSFLGNVSQLMSFAVVAIVAAPFFRGKQKGWKIAYFVALAVLAVFIVWPLIESILNILPEKKPSSEFIRLLTK